MAVVHERTGGALAVVGVGVQQPVVTIRFYWGGGWVQKVVFSRPLKSLPLKSSKKPGSIAMPSG